MTTTSPPKFSLRSMPDWLNMAPWFVVGCALVLAALVLVMNYRSARKESDISATIYLERGSSLIYAYEATLRAGLGFKWSDDELQEVMDGLATSPDIYFMAVTDMRGRVLAASQPELPGLRLLSPDNMAALAPGPSVRGAVHDFNASVDGALPSHTFLTYKTVVDRQNADRLRQHHNMRTMRMRSHRGVQGAMPSEPDFTEELVVFIAYDMTPLRQAQADDERRAAVYGAVLGFLALVGVMTLFLIKSYRRSRRMVQETTAFSFALIDNLPLGLIAVDEEGRVTTFNPEAVRMTGISEKSASGSVLADCLPDLWRFLHARGLLDSSTVHQEELRCLFGKNRRVPVALTVAPIATEDGTKAGHTIIMRDLGEIRRLEAELRRQDRLAALGSMAAGVAHEIRNPLGAIKGLARLLSESSSPGSQESKAADIMTREVLRLDKVVGELLDLSRPDSLTLAPVELSAFFERLRGMVAQDLEHGQIRFHLNMPEPSPVPVMDSDRMTQVFLNLFLNAIQAMPDGGDLTVRVLPPSRDGNWDNFGSPPLVRFEVEDTGQGIAPENLGAVFSPYFTTKAKGTGLGLSLVHKIVEAHDGLMEVISEPDKGTCFSISLPMPLALSPTCENDDA